MKFDVIVLGAGLAGSAFAAALRGSNLKIAIVEARPPQRPAGWDARIYAISPANADFLTHIGIWPHLDASRTTPVYDMEVHGDTGGRLHFSAYDCGLRELAWIVESSLMQQELWETVKRQHNVSLLCPATPAALALDEDAARLTLADGRRLEARLIVGADGRDSWLRQAADIDAHDTHYQEKGVVANFRCTKPHHNRAFQWFRDDGVLAYLPLPGNQISIVWSAADAFADSLLALTPEALSARVAAAGGERLGALELITPATAFPLRLMRVSPIVQPRLALIGDAAHAIHPLSGHGINLGYQDARELAAQLHALPAWRDPGEVAVLRAYARARAEETALLQYTTHGLNRLFKAPLLAGLRNFGLNLTQRMPVLRNALVRYAIAGRL
jgi:ubiquinone biosynthesis UbiH/UbiF/VisC/COQ6 family hydroxylase